MISGSGVMTRRQGFTLVELLVVIAVTVLLSGFLLAYSGTSRAQIGLSVERAKLIQVIVRAKSLAIETYGSSVCGYGVRVLDPTHYALMSFVTANCESVATVDPAATNSIETYQLTANFSFDPTSVNVLVAFVPPDPRTIIMSGGSAVQSGAITLRSGNTTASTGVTISSAGQISY